jgi:hypothetical protein
MLSPREPPAAGAPRLRVLGRLRAMREEISIAARRTLRRSTPSAHNSAIGRIGSPHSAAFVRRGVRRITASFAGAQRRRLHKSRHHP